MLSSSSMPVSSARDLMHNNSNDAMVIWGSRIWGLRALGLAVGVAGVLLLALVITGEDSSNNRSNSNKSKFILTDVGARFSGMNEKGTLDTNDDNLPAGHMLNDDRPYITLFGACDNYPLHPFDKLPWMPLEPLYRPLCLSRL